MAVASCLRVVEPASVPQTSTCDEDMRTSKWLRGPPAVPEVTRELIAIADAIDSEADLVR